MRDGSVTALPLAAAPVKGHGALWLEVLTAFIVLPVAIGWMVAPAWWVPSLWAITALAVLTVRRDRDAGGPATNRVQEVDAGQQGEALRQIAARFFACAGVLVLGMIVWMPERLFEWPRNRPIFWLTLVILYPIVSAFPQEVLYRKYFFRRYAPLFRTPAQRVIASALVFAWMHVIFRNEYALILTLLGGVMFAQTYGRTGSLRLASLEHALYGNLLFTIGLGSTIYHGAVD